MSSAKIQMSILAVCAASLAMVRAADDGLPKPLSFDRYEPMLKQPLFAVATAAAAVPAATPNFAKDLYVANAARSPEGDMVTIASTADPNFKKYLTTNTPADGYSISSIEWSDRVGATKVTISKDGQFATLTFNEALLSQRPAGPAAGPPMPGGPQPQPPGAGRVPRPIEAPPQPQPFPTRAPHVRGMIPRYPGAATPVPQRTQRSPQG